MTNNSSKPDKIWATAGAYPSFGDEDWVNASASAKNKIGDVYLLATPERELASELVAIARKSLTYHLDESEHQGELCCYEGAAYHQWRVREISAILAKLESEETQW